MKQGFLFSILICISLHLQAKKCVLIANVIDRDSKEVYLFKASDSPFKTPEKGSLLKIKNHRIGFSFDYDVVEAYMLVFKEELDEGAYNAVRFFPCDTVKMELFSSEDFSVRNKIVGGELNRFYGEYIALQHNFYKGPLWRNKIGEQKALEEAGLFFSEEMSSLMKQVRAANEDKKELYAKIMELQNGGLDITPKGKTVRSGLDSLTDVYYSTVYKELDKNQNEAALFIMYRDIQSAEKNNTLRSLIKKNLKWASHQFPNHPYTIQLNTFLENQERLKDEAKFVDLYADDAKGNAIKFSSLFGNNKLVLLNFWGSWCGPCIAKMDKVLPLYEKYKDKGFEVISIAREYKTTKSWRSRIKENGFKWYNLVELDNKYNLTNSYALVNAAGKLILLEPSSGKIIAIDPTTEELAEKLAVLL